MQKRRFLSAVAAAGAFSPLLAQGVPRRPPGPALLTLTGEIGKVNRGPFDPALDQMMHKHKLSFNKAHTFDFDTLSNLPATIIRPTLEYDGKAHTLHGPALIDVLKAAGAAIGDGSKLVLRAVDGYAVTMPVAQARKQGFIVATHLDQQPMGLGGLGPLWAIYDADRAPEMAAKPLHERFAACPWALYHIEVQA